MNGAARISDKATSIGASNARATDEPAAAIGTTKG